MAFLLVYEAVKICRKKESKLARIAYNPQCIFKEGELLLFPTSDQGYAVIVFTEM